MQTSRIPGFLQTFTNVNQKDSSQNYAYIIIISVIMHLMKIKIDAGKVSGIRKASFCARDELAGLVA